jgi:hypothetical protein
MKTTANVCPQEISELARNSMVRRDSNMAVMTTLTKRSKVGSGVKAFDRRKPVSTKTQEVALAKHCTHLGDRFYGLILQTLSKVGCETAETNNFEHSLSIYGNSLSLSLSLSLRRAMSYPGCPGVQGTPISSQKSPSTS